MEMRGKTRTIGPAPHLALSHPVPPFEPLGWLAAHLAARCLGRKEAILSPHFLHILAHCSRVLHARSKLRCNPLQRLQEGAYLTNQFIFKLTWQFKKHEITLFLHSLITLEHWPLEMACIIMGLIIHNRMGFMCNGGIRVSHCYDVGSSCILPAHATLSTYVQKYSGGNTVTRFYGFGS